MISERGEKYLPVCLRYYLIKMVFHQDVPKHLQNPIDINGIIAFFGENFLDWESGQRKETFMLPETLLSILK